MGQRNTTVFIEFAGEARESIGTLHKTGEVFDQRKIRYDGRRLHGRREADGHGVVVVNGNGGGIRLRDSSDFLCAQNAATGYVGIEDVRGLVLKKTKEFLFRI